MDRCVSVLTNAQNSGSKNLKTVLWDPLLVKEAWQQAGTVPGCKKH